MRPSSRAAFVTLCLFGLAVAACGTGARLTGTNLGNTPAPDFTLNDASGRSFSLHNHRGHAIVLTFLYTQCPDICPAIASKLARVGHALGREAERVDFVAVSVDPPGDTPENVARFTAEHDLGILGAHWQYGLGSLEELSTVWHAYGIGAEPEPAAASLVNRDAAGIPVISHNAVLYLIDADGRERTLLHPDVLDDELLRDLRLLIH